MTAGDGVGDGDGLEPPMGGVADGPGVAEGETAGVGDGDTDGVGDDDTDGDGVGFGDAAGHCVRP